MRKKIGQTKKLQIAKKKHRKVFKNTKYKFEMTLKI